jgi:5'(3')-deoxyribonucleotidase
MARADEFVLGVDLDGVCADFYAGLRPIAAEWLEVDEGTLPQEVSFGLKEWGLPGPYGEYKDLHRFAVTQRDLFRRLEPIPGCGINLRKLSKAHVRIRIITHRLFIEYFHQVAVQQTVEWLDRYGIPYWDLCFMRDKDAVGADLYIEDSPENIDALREKGCEVIVFANSTNRHCAEPRAGNWDEAYELVMERYSEWQAGGPGA